ncbi:hypothetical protein A2U01_0029275 [Trifolium medium]|uniref:Uncharacterized protein n=1 Tax=Trifolium medium TaxID=97028 RepID=A0A392P9T6_9FABA|nr:hypothetical protein [Trifolium medium]
MPSSTLKGGRALKVVEDEHVILADTNCYIDRQRVAMELVIYATPASGDPPV